MKKVIICFFCLMFVQSSFGYVKVKSLAASRSDSSSYNTENTYSTGNTYRTGNTHSAGYKRVSTPTRMSSMGGGIGASITPKTNIKPSGGNTSTGTNNWATQSQIDSLDSLINGLESQVGNFQTGLDGKPNIADVYTKTEVDDKIDAISIGGTPGADGLSAYQIAVNAGFIGSEAEWMASLKGDKGDPGEKGERGDGLSAYQIAVNAGFIGSEAEWMASLKGDKGDPGEKGDKGDAGESIPFGCGSGEGSYLLSVQGGTTNCKYVELTSDNFVE